MTRTARLATAVIFFFSGFAALIYQVVWQRVLTQEIGCDSVSVTFIVTIFMIGLGFGALAGGALVSRFRTSLPLCYAVMELLIGFYGAFSVTLLREANSGRFFGPTSSVLADFLVNCAALVLPIFLMGMTSPIIMELMKHSLARWGRVVGVFYGLNVLGAAAGALLTGLVLIEVLGLKQTACVAAIVNVLIAIAFYVLTRSRLWTAAGTQSAAPSPVDPMVPPAPRLAPRLATAAVLFGFTTLGLEMIFFRVLTNYFTLSSAVFPIMLTAFLILMSAGQLLSGTLIDRIGPPRRALLLVGLLVGTLVTSAISFAIRPSSLASIGVMVFTPSVQPFDIAPGVTFGTPHPLNALWFSLIFMLPVLFASGCFPCVVKIATRDLNDAGAVFGKVLFWSTIGNILGAYVTGIWLFEYLGTVRTLFTCAALFTLGVLILTEQLAEAPRTRWAVRGAAMASLALVVLLVPARYYDGFSLGRYTSIDVVEGRGGVLSVVPHDDGYYRLDMFRTESAAVLPKVPATGLHSWNFSDVLALDSGFTPRRVLVIGMGHGYLARGLLEYDHIEKITVVELSAEVVHAVEKYSDPQVTRILNDPRVEIIMGDGRRFVQKALARGEKYDLIQINVNNPWRSGASSLYTVEFLRNLKSLLQPGGYVAMRAMIGYVTSGLEVFEQAFWCHQTHVYFRDGTSRFAGPVIVPRSLAPQYLAETLGPQAIPAGKTSVPDLHITYFQRSDVAGYPPNTDDCPMFEYRFLEDLRPRYKDPRVFMAKLKFDEQTEILPVQLEADTDQSARVRSPLP